MSVSSSTPLFQTEKQLNKALDSVSVPFNFFCLSSDDGDGFNDPYSILSEFETFCQNYFKSRENEKELKNFCDFISIGSFPPFPFCLSYKDTKFIFQNFFQIHNNDSNAKEVNENFWLWENLEPNFEETEFYFMINNVNHTNRYLVNVFPKILINSEEDFIFYGLLKTDNSLTILDIRIRILENMNLKSKNMDWKSINFDLFEMRKKREKKSNSSSSVLSCTCHEIYKIAPNRTQYEQIILNLLSENDSLKKRILEEDENHENEGEKEEESKKKKRRILKITKKFQNNDENVRKIPMMDSSSSSSSSSSSEDVCYTEATFPHDNCMDTDIGVGETKLLPDADENFGIIMADASNGNGNENGNEISSFPHTSSLNLPGYTKDEIHFIQSEYIENGNEMCDDSNKF